MVLDGEFKVAVWLRVIRIFISSLAPTMLQRGSPKWGVQ